MGVNLYMNISYIYISLKIILHNNTSILKPNFILSSFEI